MTTQQIKDLIAQTIAGQGNQVDSGGKLAEILNAIVSAIPTDSQGRAIIYRSSYTSGLIPNEEYNRIYDAGYLQIADGNDVFPRINAFDEDLVTNELSNIRIEYNADTVTPVALFGTFAISNGEFDGGTGVLLFGATSDGDNLYGLWNIEI